MTNVDRLENTEFVASLREAARHGDAEWDVEREAALIDRVLERTTQREVPLFSFDGFRQSFQRSGLVKLVAASLVLHLGALSVVGMLALTKDREPLAIKVEFAPLEEVVEVEPVEEESIVVPPEELAVERADEVFANRLRLDRFLLARDAEEFASATWLDLEQAERRVRSITTRQWQLAPLDGLTDLEICLGAALALDAFAFGVELDERQNYLERLATLDGEYQGLARDLLARSRAYGLGSDPELAIAEAYERHPLAPFRSR